jgi:hypothetical protein
MAIPWDRGRPRPQTVARGLVLEKCSCCPIIAGEGARGPNEGTAFDLNRSR